ncbi:MAG TPA: aminotransferase, partial [Actinomycetota bacterium]|nr:aminotransferase [Actinomycetota bacterium]
MSETHSASRRMAQLAKSFSSFLEFATLPHLERRSDPGVCDFVFGNPHDPVVEGYVEARQRAMVPRDKDWFAYKLN